MCAPSYKFYGSINVLYHLQLEKHATSQLSRTVMEMEYRLLLKNARQLVQVVSNGEKCLIGDAMKKLVILQGNESGFSLVVDK